MVPMVRRRTILLFGAILVATIVAPVPAGSADVGEVELLERNRRKIVEYSDRYALSPNTPYYKKYGNDCANFASQAWYEGGGLPMVGSAADVDNPYSTPYVWFSFKAGLGRRDDSRTWTVTEDFGTYMVRERGVAVYRSVDLASWVSPENDVVVSWNPANLGDVIQYSWGVDRNGRRRPFSHSAVEAGWGYFAYQDYENEDGQQLYLGDYMNQHTTNRYHAPWNWWWLIRSKRERELARARIVHISLPESGGGGDGEF